MLTLKESVRWYTMKGRHEEAWESLKWIRASDGPEVKAEMEDIRVGVQNEAKETEGFKLTGLFSRLLALTSKANDLWVL